MIGLYLFCLVTLSAFVWLCIGVKRIGSVSRGQQIGQRTKTALLLIDLQTVFWDHGPYTETAKQAAQTAILKEVETAKAQGHPVIAIRQEWSYPSTKAVAKLLMKGQAIAGSPGTELAAPFARVAEHSMTKRVQDAFETGELDAVLAKLHVGKLRLVGLDLRYCVAKTALAARHRGYNVTIVGDGTLSATPAGDVSKRLSQSGVAFQ